MIPKKSKWLQNFFTNDIEQGTKLPDQGRGIFGPQNYAKEIRATFQDKFWHKSPAGRWVPEIGSVWKGRGEGWAQPTQNPLETTRQQMQAADERRVDMTVVFKITRSDPNSGLISTDMLWKYDIPDSPIDAKFPNQHLEPVLIPAWGVADPFKHDEFTLVDSMGSEIKWKFPDKNRVAMTYFMGKTSNIVNVSRERIIHPKLILSVHCVRISPFKAPTFTRGEVLAAERPMSNIAGAGRESTLDQLRWRIRSLTGLLKVKVPKYLEEALKEENEPTSDHDWYTRLVTLEGYAMRLEMLVDPLPPNENALQIFDEWFKENGEIVPLPHGKDRVALEDARNHNKIAAKGWGEGPEKGHTGMIPAPKVGEPNIQTGLPSLRYYNHLVFVAHLSPVNVTSQVFSPVDLGFKSDWSHMKAFGIARLTLKLVDITRPSMFYTISANNISGKPSSIELGYGRPHHPGKTLHNLLEDCANAECTWDERGRIFKTQGTWNLQPEPEAGLETLLLVVTAFLNANIFVKVSTALHPNGELIVQALGHGVKPW